MRAIFFVLSLLCVSSAVSAAELLVTHSSAKSGSSVSLDVVSSGDVSSFEFFLNTGKVKPSGIDCSKCLADLPKGFTGSYRVHETGIQFVVMADQPEALPSGVVSIGRIFVSSTAKLGGNAFSVERIEMANVRGDVVASSGQVAE